MTKPDDRFSALLSATLFARGDCLPRLACNRFMLPVVQTACRFAPENRWPRLDFYGLGVQHCVGTEEEIVSHFTKSFAGAVQQLEDLPRAQEMFRSQGLDQFRLLPCVDLQEVRQTRERLGKFQHKQSEEEMAKVAAVLATWNGAMDTPNAAKNLIQALERYLEDHEATGRQGYKL